MIARDFLCKQSNLIIYGQKVEERYSYYFFPSLLTVVSRCVILPKANGDVLRFPAISPIFGLQRSFVDIYCFLQSSYPLQQQFFLSMKLKLKIKVITQTFLFQGFVSTELPVSLLNKPLTDSKEKTGSQLTISMPVVLIQVGEVDNKEVALKAIFRRQLKMKPI